MGAVLLLHYWKGIPIGELTRDPNAVFEGPFYIGFLSQLGIFFWTASAAICILSAKVLSGPKNNLKTKRFFYLSGTLTLVLAFDDIFLLHEEFFPRFGISEKVILLCYATFILFFLVRFYSLILKTEYVLLVMAFIFFGLSVFLDLFQPEGIDPHLMEDGAKLVGIVSWLAYFFRTGASAISHNTTQHVATPDG